MPAASGGAAEAGRAHPAAVVNQDATKDSPPERPRGAVRPAGAKPGDVLLSEQAAPQSQGVGVLSLGDGCLGVIPHEPDGLLEMPVRLGQPGPGARADRTAPRCDEVPGGSDRCACYEHRLVEHGASPYLPLGVCPVAGKRIAERGTGPLHVSKRCQGVEWSGCSLCPSRSCGLVRSSGEAGPLVAGPSGQQGVSIGYLGADFAQRSGERGVGLGQPGGRTLHCHEQVGSLIGGGLGRLQRGRNRRRPYGSQLRSSIGDNGRGEVQPLGCFIRVGGDCVDGLRRVSSCEAGQYLAGRADPGGLLGHMSVHFGQQLRHPRRGVLQPVERLGVVIEHSACLEAPGRNLGELSLPRRVTFLAVLIQ